MSPQTGKKEARRPLGKRPTPAAHLDEFAVLTLRQIADYLDCHYTTVYGLARHGEIPSFKLGNEWRFLKSTSISG